MSGNGQDFSFSETAEVNPSLLLLSWAPVLLLHGQDVEAAGRRAVAVLPVHVGQDLLQV